MSSPSLLGQVPTELRLVPALVRNGLYCLLEGKFQKAGPPSQGRWVSGQAQN